VPNIPDPDSSGQVPKADPQALGVSSTQLQAAQQACQNLYPSNGGTLSASSLRQCYESGACAQALVQQAVNAGLKFARRMLSQGVPNWPDPTIDSRGRPLFDIAVPGDHGFAPGRACPLPHQSRGGRSTPRSTNASAWSPRRTAGVGVRPRVAFASSP
jgi:hypothetical protein